MLRERAATSCGDVAYFTAYAVGLPTADALSRRRRPRRPVPFLVGVQRGSRTRYAAPDSRLQAMLGVSTLMLRDFPALELSRLLASGDGVASRCAEFPMVPRVIANLQRS